MPRTYGVYYLYIRSCLCLCKNAQGSNGLHSHPVSQTHDSTGAVAFDDATNRTPRSSLLMRRTTAAVGLVALGVAAIAALSGVNLLHCATTTQTASHLMPMFVKTRFSDLACI